MEDIKMVDLKAQYARLKPELDQAFSAVMESMAFINGPQVKSFCRKLESYLQVKHAIPCANGTDALQLALMALDLPAGAEVIVPAFNYVAAAEVVALLGFKPVFADVHPATFNLDPASVEAAITSATAAIVPVHLFGQCAAMAEMVAVAAKHKLYIIEDNAQSLGATYTWQDGTSQYAGAIGDVATTSFFPSKPLGGMGDGGAVFTNDSRLAACIQKIANHGQSEKYKFEKVGINSRLDTLQAAMLEVKLGYIDDFNKGRQRVAAVYDKLFAQTESLEVPARSSYSTHVFHQYTIKVPAQQRDGLQAHLRQHHIPSMVYYPQPLHLQEAYRYLGYQSGDLPVSEMLAQRVLSLPMHSELTQEQQEYIAHHTITYLEQHG